MENNQTEMKDVPAGEEVEKEPTPSPAPDMVKPSEDKHRNVPEHTKLQQYLMEEMTEDKLCEFALPNGSTELIIERITHLNDVEGDTDAERSKNWVLKFKEFFGPKALATLLDIYSRSSGTGQVSDIFKDALNNEKARFVNDLVYADKHININTPKYPTGGGSVSGNNAIARFTSLLSIGDVKQIPLYHSGFWLTVTPPKQAAIVNLERAIGREQLRAGRETNTIVYSNYGVIINRIMTDFIMNHVIDSTLDVPAEELLNYISVHDLQQLALGMLCAMHPNGIDTDKYCINTLIENPETGQAKCSFFAKAKVDPAALSYKNGVMFNNAMLLTLSKRRPNSVSVGEVKQYQSYLDSISTKTVVVKAANEQDVTVTFKVPMLADHLISGDAWMNNIIKQTEAIFTAADTKEVKDNKVYGVITSVILALFNTFVSSIEMEDAGGRISATDPLTVTSLLEVLSDDEKLSEQLFAEIKSFISNSIIATVATQNFICPECGKNQNEEYDGHPAFRELIPINITEVFFVLSAIRFKKMVMKDIY